MKGFYALSLPLTHLFILQLKIYPNYYNHRWYSNSALNSQLTSVIEKHCTYLSKTSDTNGVNNCFFTKSIIITIKNHTATVNKSR